LNKKLLEYETNFKDLNEKNAKLTQELESLKSEQKKTNGKKNPSFLKCLFFV
jgi:hypothetical protein